MRLYQKFGGGGTLIISTPTPNYSIFFGKKITFNQIEHVRDGYTVEDLSKMLDNAGGMSVTYYQYHTWLISGICCRYYYKFNFLESALGNILRMLFHPLLIIISKFDFIKLKPSGFMLIAKKDLS